MECKEHFSQIMLIAFCHVLIETLWNVKISINAGLKVLSCVLIETLWNVKEIHIVAAKSFDIVLIETLWNVKIVFG